MKIKDIITENEWWMNSNIKYPTPDPRYGPDANENEYEIYNILIDGKLWIKNGSPVEFHSIESAKKAVKTIALKFGKTSQIVPG